jgi:hypothetical protein
LPRKVIFVFAAHLSEILVVLGGESAIIKVQLYTQEGQRVTEKTHWKILFKMAARSYSLVLRHDFKAS